MKLRNIFLVGLVALGCGQREAPQKLIIAWGDSLTAGVYEAAGALSFPSVLERLTGAKVINAGSSGHTSTQILWRIQSRPRLPINGEIIWMGRNNWNSADTVKADIAEAVKVISARTDKYVILSILNADLGGIESKVSEGYEKILGLNKDLAGQYPEHFLDIREWLVQAGDPKSPADLESKRQDLPAASLRLDYVHLNAEGNKVIAKRLHDWMIAKNW